MFLGVVLSELRKKWIKKIDYSQAVFINQKYAESFKNNDNIS